MSQEYFIQANNHETIKVTKEEYRANNRIKYMDGDESQKKQVTMDYLGGIRANSGAVIPGKDALEKTSIKSRKAYGEAIRNAEKERFEKIDKYTDKALGNSNIDKSCVKNIAAFFTGKKNMDRALIKGYTEMPQNSEVVLKYCISDFLSLPIENLNISSPKKLAAKASVLEKLSAKHEAIVRLIVERREDYDNLPEDLRDRFENKLGEANGLINYYRLMKSLMTDSYYLNNDVSKLSRQDPKKDTPDQKRVRTLLLSINGGALALKTKGTEILNRYLDSMAGTLQTNVVSTDNIRLSKDLLSHKEKLEGLSISQYLDRLEHEGNVDGFDKPKAKGLFERGKSSITLLNLPESVEDSYGKIGAILNQLDFVNDLIREKNDHKGFYYMEQDFRDIAILDEVEKLSAPLKDLKEVILSHGGISEDGTLEIGKLSDKQRKDLQMRYTGAITKYRDIFAAINEYRSDLYLNPPEDADMDAAFTKFRTYADKSVKERGRTRIPDKKEQENLREDLRLLYLTLSEGRYSDYVIYNNAPKIIELKIKCQAFLTKAESERLDSFVYLANELRINKKKIDLSRALSCKGATDEELLNLSREKEELEAYEKDIAKISDAATLKNKEVQQKLRNEAQKMEYDSADFRAEASNYLFHEEWLKNTYRKKEKFSFGSIYDYVKGKTILGLTRFVSWVYSRKRTHHHGAELYDVARRNLARMPQELKNFGEEGADQSITFGDGTYAPKVELNKYFKDPMKMQLYNDYREIAGLMQAGKNYPESMQDAAEALSGYCEVRGLVNRDTYEMEHAFLEKFNLSVNKMLEEEQGEYPLIRRKIHEAYKHYVQMSCGTLGSHLKPGELKAIEETKAVYTQKTFFGDSEESNMRNLPLFPHSPNLNDIKQGVIGNCYMMAAVQTILSTEPESIRDMFLDLGDGNVIVRLYAAYGEVEKKGKKAYTRIDDPAAMGKATMRPVYVKVKKHYETGEEASCDCMWMQLLEKAYAAAGFNHGKPDIDENGVLKNINEELTEGEPHVVLMHLTGRAYISKNRSDVASDSFVRYNGINNSLALSDYQMRVIFKGVPTHLHSHLYTQLLLKVNNQDKYDKDLGSEDELIREVVRHSLDDLKNCYLDAHIDTRFDELVKKGNLTVEQKDNLLRELDDFTNNEDFMVNMISSLIRRNLNDNAILADTSKVSDRLDIGRMVTLLEQKVTDEKVTYEDLRKIIFTKEDYYKPEGYETLVTDQEKDLMRSNIKSFLIPNKGKRYSPSELNYLKVILTEVREGRTVPMVYNGGHVVTALDVKLHDGKWFVLIRDPFNVEHAEYTQNEEEEVEKKLPGLSDVFHNHTAVRELSPDMKTGFMGISWWELKDVADKCDDFVLPQNKPKKK